MALFFVVEEEHKPPADILCYLIVIIKQLRLSNKSIMKHWNIQRMLCKLPNYLFIGMKCIRFETDYNIHNNSC